jgi:hypothetical protein
MPLPEKPIFPLCAGTSSAHFDSHWFRRCRRQSRRGRRPCNGNSGSCTNRCT